MAARKANKRVGWTSMIAINDECLGVDVDGDALMADGWEWRRRRLKNDGLPASLGILSFA